jgi:hypothetical protein
VTLTRSELDQQPGTPARALARRNPDLHFAFHNHEPGALVHSWSARLSPTTRSSTIARAELPKERISGYRGLRSSGLRSQLAAS